MKINYNLHVNAMTVMLILFNIKTLNMYTKYK